MKAKTYRTPNGTELVMASIQGRDYLQVAQRLIWFREERPLWTLDTHIIELDESHAIVRAVVRDESGRQLATAVKSETRSGFPDFLEKAETGAIGRALALCGYGTQFALELDEGERVVDSPQGPASGDGRGPVKEASAKQKKFVADLAVRKLGAEPGDRDHIVQRLNEHFGFELRSSADLTLPQATAIIVALIRMPDLGDATAEAEGSFGNEAA